jgi:hypothetical protein
VTRIRKTNKEHEAWSLRADLAEATKKKAKMKKRENGAGKSVASGIFHRGAE